MNADSMNMIPETTETEETTTPRASHEPISVLLADDHTILRAGLRMMLSVQPDLEIVGEASDGRQAIVEAQRLQPDVILMDASMPVLDGWQATRELKSNPATEHIPILALTAHAFDDARQQAKAVGCDGFVTKPCLPDDLVARVRATLEGGQKKLP